MRLAKRTEKAVGGLTPTEGCWETKPKRKSLLNQQQIDSRVEEETIRLVLDGGSIQDVSASDQM